MFPLLCALVLMLVVLLLLLLLLYMPLIRLREELSVDAAALDWHAAAACIMPGALRCRVAASAVCICRGLGMACTTCIMALTGHTLLLLLLLPLLLLLWEVG
jgi:hypothetical protein